MVEARRRRLVYPYEIVRMLTGAPGAVELAGEKPLPAGCVRGVRPRPSSRDPPRAVSVAGRPPAQNTSAIVFGIIDTPTERVPEGMRRVLILSDPTLGMGSLAAPECDRIVAAIDLAEANGCRSSGCPCRAARASRWTAAPRTSTPPRAWCGGSSRSRRRAASIHVIVAGINVGAQSYFDALATMLLHTRGVLIMTPGASMVLTGRAALEASGSVSAEDEIAIGGYERVMGPNGEAQYYARNLAEAYAILYEHYRYSYVVPGEAAPRALPTQRPARRAPVTEFTTRRRARARLRPDRRDLRRRAQRRAQAAVRDARADARGGRLRPGQLERWRDWAGAETAIVWDASLGGIPSR